MIEEVIVLSIVTAVGFYITIGIIKFNKQLKEDERSNNRNTPIINQERYNIKGDKEIPENKASNKRESSRSKKKTTKSKKIKQNAGRNKKKV